LGVTMRTSRWVGRSKKKKEKGGRHKRRRLGPKKVMGIRDIRKEVVTAKPGKGS